jgi:hypothetical protein
VDYILRVFWLHIFLLSNTGKDDQMWGLLQFFGHWVSVASWIKSQVLGSMVEGVPNMYKALGSFHPQHWKKMTGGLVAE